MRRTNVIPRAFPLKVRQREPEFRLQSLQTRRKRAIAKEPGNEYTYKVHESLRAVYNFAYRAVQPT